MSRTQRLAGWAAVVALAGTALVLQAPRPRAPTRLFLLGPLAPLAAQVQWLRSQAAGSRGQEARALELAESALALDPSRVEGWERLAAHLLFDLASREREPDLARRRSLFEAGRAVLARGGAQSSEPGELELFQALAWISKASSDPELHPLGARGLYDEAVVALERAAARGESRAAELLPQARALAAEAR